MNCDSSRDGTIGTSSMTQLKPSALTWVSRFGDTLSAYIVLWSLPFRFSQPIKSRYRHTNAFGICTAEGLSTIILTRRCTHRGFAPRDREERLVALRRIALRLVANDVVEFVT